jgi:hypothetical protein
MKKECNLFNFLSASYIFIVLLLSGCSTPLLGTYGENGQSREEFSRYVESVFRLQNAMTSEIMALQGIDDVSDHTALFQADQAMQKACGPLNEFVSRQTEGLDTGLFLSHQVEKSAIDCEQAAQKVKLLLDR